MTIQSDSQANLPVLLKCFIRMDQKNNKQTARNSLSRSFQFYTDNTADLTVSFSMTITVFAFFAVWAQHQTNGGGVGLFN